MRVLIVTGIFIMAAVGASRAQSLSGVAYDPTGAVVPGARVMLMQDYVKMREMKSSPAGEFSFAGLKAGQYQLQIKQPKFSLYQTTVLLEGNQDARVYAVLPLARFTEQLGINAQLPAGAVRTKPPDAAIRVGGNLEPAVALAPLRPVYPPGALAKGVEGPVVLFAAIKTDGSVGDAVCLQSPSAELRDAALDVLKKCRYQPAKLNGQPVEAQITIVLDFRLK